MSDWLPELVQGGTFRFAAPYMLLALLLLPFLYFWLRHRDKINRKAIVFPVVGIIRSLSLRSPLRWRGILDLLRILALAFLIVGMARPQFGRVERQTYSEGIDISLVLDVSLSMRTGDFLPNRLEAAKDVLKQFVDERKGDRLSLVVFGSEAVTLVPLTLDYGVVRNFIDRVGFNIVDGNSTAIGMGLATALNKLKDSKAKSKVVILLTDGENNAGKIDPLKAAEAARASKVRVYTIGVGSNSTMGPFGMRMEAGLDEKTLSQMAQMTGGKYFRATDNAKLSSIYDQIDKLEKSKVESTQFDNFNDLIRWVTVPALLLLIIETLLRTTRFIKVP